MSADDPDLQGELAGLQKALGESFKRISTTRAAREKGLRIRTVAPFPVIIPLLRRPSNSVE